MRQKGLNTSLLQKILIAFLISGLAITGLYMLSRQAFFRINQSFHTLSAPNQKLNAVNRLFAEVVLSDKSFSDLVANEQEKSLQGFLQHSDAIAAYTDSLRMLCANNIAQTALIDSIHNLVKLRKQRMLEHFSFRQDINRRSNFTSDIRVLDSIISADTGKAETTIFTNRQTVTTTTFDTVEYETWQRGIINRIFKPKKKTTIAIPVEETKVIVNRDTLEKVADTVLFERAQKLMDNISKKRLVVQRESKQKEASINRFEKEFKEKVTKLLFAIEDDIIHQTEQVQSTTRATLNSNVAMVRYILIAFGIASAILFILMVIDMARSNRYRKLLERATAEAEQASQSKQALLSNVSHEIRTPLQSIIGYAEQLQLVPGNTGFTQAISKASGHLLQVVNEVLDYSSIEAGKFIFNEQDFDAESVIEEVVVMMQPAVEAKGLSLKLDNQLAADVVVHGDAYRLKQVLLNLLGNAVKFTDRGSITLAANANLREAGWLLSFSVRDTGRGIPVTEQARIFERFEQVAMAEGNTRGGSGLGLSITRAIVEAQGGTIGLKSTPGNGSVFTFNIPYKKGAAIAEVVENQTILSPPLTSLVWFLDDDNLIGRLVSLILTRHQIAHRIFTNGEDLLSELEGGSPDIILTDISMPGMSGAEVCRRSRLLSPQTKVVAVTAHALPGEQQALMLQGFDRVIAKPFNEAKLLAALAFDNREEDAKQHTEPATGNPVNIMKKATGVMEDESFREIASQFSGDMHEDMAALQTAISNKDNRAQTALFHRIAGRLAQLGFNGLAVSFRGQEIISRRKAINDFGDIEPLWNEVEDMMNQVDEYLFHAAET